jgi:hypothetical protein
VCVTRWCVGRGQRGRMSRAARYNGRTAFASFYACRVVRSWSCTGGERVMYACMHAQPPPAGPLTTRLKVYFSSRRFSFGYSHKAI